MTVANFAACLPVILKSEGGYVVDQGGATMLGVTQRALSAWLGRAASVAEVKALRPDTVAPLYLADYYNPAHCHELSPGVDLMVFDEAVNEGVGRAIRHLQEALGVHVDGDFGDLTRAAARRGDPRTLIRALHDDNAEYYESLAGEFPADLAGWLARNARTATAALAMARPRP